MAFDKAGFLKAGFVPRTADVPVPELAEYFPDGEPVWRVRGLTGHEIAAVNQRVDTGDRVRQIIAGLVSGSGKEQRDAAAKLAGHDGQTPVDIARRLEYLRLGSVEPSVDEDLASRLCQFFGVAFFGLTNKILELSGRGHVPGKQRPSGETTASERP